MAILSKLVGSVKMQLKSRRNTLAKIFFPFVERGECGKAGKHHQQHHCLGHWTHLELTIKLVNVNIVNMVTMINMVYMVSMINMVNMVSMVNLVYVLNMVNWSWCTLWSAQCAPGGKKEHRSVTLKDIVLVAVWKFLKWRFESCSGGLKVVQVVWKLFRWCFESCRWFESCSGGVLKVAREIRKEDATLWWFPPKELHAGWNWPKLDQKVSAQERVFLKEPEKILSTHLILVASIDGRHF